MKYYFLILTIILLPQITFGTSYKEILPTEKILLLEHRTKDKTKKIELGTEITIETKDGTKIKGFLTDFYQDILVIDNQAIPLSKIERIKFYKRNKALLWILWIFSIISLAVLIDLLAFENS